MQGLLFLLQKHLHRSIHSSLLVLAVLAATLRDITFLAIARKVICAIIGSLSFPRGRACA